jgi:hypothetical protein
MQQEVSVSMFEKLLSLLLHAKGGAVATVLVLGASGALVTATVENGLTTVTITQPSTTTNTTTDGSTTTTTTTTDPVILALFNNTKKEGASEPATGNGCSDAAHTNNEQVKLVNDAYKTDHAAVQALSKTAPKTDAARTLVKSSDNKIKGFRQGAVKQIHDLFKSDECKGNADEDKADEDKDTEDDDNDSTTGATGATGATTGTTSTTTTTTVAISCSDAKACADAAIKAMKDEVKSLTAALAGLTTAPATTNTTTDKSKSDTKSTKTNNGKGKGHSEGKSHNDDD